ncbi:MAG: hypothetical protein M1541_14785 [Acidobacteria bacterium]|nr:hypothetical protein [Acidobacteriota bacterium]
MASTLSRSNAAVNAEADNVCALLNNGYLRIYSGTQPANADTALSGNTLLAELRFSAMAFAAAVAGQAVANAIATVTAAASGTASFFRTFKSDGSTAVMDGSVGTAGSDCNINATAIAIGANVSVSSMSYTATK